MYIVIKNSCGCEIARIEVESDSFIEQSLIEVINEYMVVLEIGDTITFEQMV